MRELVDGSFGLYTPSPHGMRCLQSLTTHAASFTEDHGTPFKRVSRLLVDMPPLGGRALYALKFGLW